MRLSRVGLGLAPTERNFKMPDKIERTSRTPDFFNLSPSIAVIQSLTYPDSCTLNVRCCHPVSGEYIDYLVNLERLFKICEILISKKKDI